MLILMVDRDFVKTKQVEERFYDKRSVSPRVSLSQISSFLKYLLRVYLSFPKK